MGFIHSGVGGGGFLWSPGGGPFSPDGIADLAHWYRSDDITGIADAATITSWPNRVDGAPALGAPSSGWGMPKFQAVGLGGEHPSVEFNGGEACQAGTAVVARESTFFFLIAQDSGGALQTVMDVANGSGRIQRYTATSAREFYAGAWLSPADVASAGVAEILTIGSAGTASFMRENGVQLGTGTANTGADMTDLVIGSWRTGADRFNGRISEILVYNRALDAAEIGDVEGYLAGRYGITI